MSIPESLTIIVKDIKYTPLNGREENAIRVGTNDVKVGDDDATVPSNVFIGHGAGAQHANTFTSSVFIGKNAGFSAAGVGNTGSTGGVFIGVGAGYNSAATNGNILIGTNSGYQMTTGSDNVGIGNDAGVNIRTGNHNSFVGSYAGQGFSTGASQNIAIGFSSQAEPFIGNYNTVIGTNSNCETGGNNNIILGTNSNQIGSPSNCLAIGNDISTNGSNVIAIGDEVKSNTDYTISIGGPVHTAMYIGCGGDDYGRGDTGSTGPVLTSVYFNKNSHVNGAQCTLYNVTTSSTSDVRLKSEIVENVQGLGFVNKLRPVTYLMYGKKTLGMIAQEVEQTVKDVHFDNFDAVIQPGGEAQFYEMKYISFITPLVKAVQELSADLTSVKSQNASLVAQLGSLATQVQTLTAEVEALKPAPAPEPTPEPTPEPAPEV
jgi:hypothetical protein